LQIGLGLNTTVPSKHGHLPELPQMLSCLKHSPVCVVKIHQPHPSLLEFADIVLTSHRDPRDAFVSARTLWPDFSVKYTIAHLKEYFNYYIFWLPFACYDMKYESMVADELTEIKRIAMMLHFPHVDERAVQRRLNDELARSRQSKVR
jgi:hypothetical protein